MIFTIAISLLILTLAWKRPAIALAVLLQTNLIRSFAEIDFKNLCFHCVNESNIILGFIIPILSFILIFVKFTFIDAKFDFKLDVFDGFFILTFIILSTGTIYAPNFLEAADYTLRFLFIGGSYYFIIKFLLSNKTNELILVKRFFYTSMFLAFVLGIVALLIINYSGQYVERITLPGVHPIPFSQLIGLALLVSFVVFYSNGKILNIENKNILRLNNILFIFFTILLFATNTRGVLFSAIIAILIFLALNIKKVKKTNLYIYGTILIVLIVIIVINIDVEVLFSRLLRSTTDKSVIDRITAYNDSINLFFNHFLGVGTNGFKYNSVLPYPHNLILENLAQYGVLGLLLNVYFLLMILYMFLVTIKFRKKDMLIVLFFSLFCFFTIETMFSFTIWMHKGMYLSLGLFAAHFHIIKNKNR